MAILPNNYVISTAAGSRFSITFTVYEDDNTTLANIVGKSFEFVVRDRLGQPGRVTFSVNNTTSTASGTIVVNTTTSVVQVIVNAVATALVTEGGGPYTLWMDPGAADATALVVGTFFASPVAAA